MADYTVQQSDPEHQTYVIYASVPNLSPQPASSCHTQQSPMFLRLLQFLTNCLPFHGTGHGYCLLLWDSSGQ
jgi:hypothetical protein